jgi:hypothetical protein
MGLLEEMKARNAAKAANGGGAAAESKKEEEPAPKKEDKINPPESKAEAKVEEKPAARVHSLPSKPANDPSKNKITESASGREQKVAVLLRAIADVLDSD